MYLVDTNIFLELLLEQERADEVRKFFSSVDSSDLSLTDLSFHSIGIILIKFKKFDVFTRFVRDIANGGMQILSLNLEDMFNLLKFVKKFGLDFDNAYQYTVAEKYNLQIISFDKDFDRTERRRKEPLDIL